MREVVLAALAAIGVQPIVFAAWFIVPPLVGGEHIASREILGLSAFVLVVAACFVLVLGVPIFLLLRRLDRARPLAVSLSGFCVAAFPLAIFAWPLRVSCPGCSYGGSWHGSSVEFEVNGAPTFYGWLNYLEGVTYYGLHGLIGALVFLFVWRRMHGSNNALERERGQ